MKAPRWSACMPTVFSLPGALTKLTSLSPKASLNRMAVSRSASRRSSIRLSLLP